MASAIKKSLLAAVILGLVAWWWHTHRPVSYPPGVLIATPPVQRNIPAMPLAEVNGFKLTALAEFRMTGRVLSKKRYHAGVQAGLVPIDLAFGWGPMSDQTILDRLRLSQSNRFFFYQWWNTPPIPQRDMAANASNMHLIPANDDVYRTIRAVRKGEVLALDGFLVNANRPDGFQWTTSLTRTDSGNGACEIVYVTSCSIAGMSPGVQSVGSRSTASATPVVLTGN